MYMHSMVVDNTFTSSFLFFFAVRNCATLSGSNADFSFLSSICIFVGYFSCTAFFSAPHDTGYTRNIHFLVDFFRISLLSTKQTTKILTAMMGIQKILTRKTRSSSTFILVALCFALFTVGALEFELYHKKTNLENAVAIGHFRLRHCKHLLPVSRFHSCPRKYLKELTHPFLGCTYSSFPVDGPRQHDFKGW